MHDLPMEAFGVDIDLSKTGDNLEAIIPVLGPALAMLFQRAGIEFVSATTKIDGSALSITIHRQRPN